MRQSETIVTPSSKSHKRGKKEQLKIAMIVTSIVIGFFIGFGIIGLIQNLQKDRQISDLKTNIENLNGEIANLETRKTDNYIYVGEWGMKIKIPNDLIIIRYNFTNNGYYKTCSRIDVSAVATNDGLEVVNNWDYTLGEIMRCLIEDEFYQGRLIFSDNAYNYYYLSSDKSIIDNYQWMQNSEILIEEMLTSADNYLTL